MDRVRVLIVSFSVSPTFFYYTMFLSALVLWFSCIFRLTVKLIFFQLISVSASHAAQSLPAQDYWEKVLPNTPMPSAIRTLISSGILFFL